MCVCVWEREGGKEGLWTLRTNWWWWWSLSSVSIKNIPGGNHVFCKSTDLTYKTHQVRWPHSCHDYLIWHHLCVIWTDGSVVEFRLCILWLLVRSLRYLSLKRRIYKRNSKKIFLISKSDFNVAFLKNYFLWNYEFKIRKAKQIILYTTEMSIAFKNHLWNIQRKCSEVWWSGGDCLKS